MMTILVFTESKPVQSIFTSISRSKSFQIEFMPMNALRKRLADDVNDTFVYTDISCDDHPHRTLQFLSRREDLLYGIIDPQGDIADPAIHFFEGASDYIGPPLMQKSLTTRRMRAVLEFRELPEGDADAIDAEHTPEEQAHIFPHSPSSWNHIKTGQEYTFLFLFAEIDLYGEWKLKSGQAHLDTVLNTFYTHMNRIFSPHGGKFWMRSDQGGLLLFPYTGNASMVIEQCFRLMMNEILTSTEEYTYNIPITYHLALDIGRTTYRASGHTGTIVADSVNFIFHLGQQYADSGNFYLTERVFQHIPGGLKGFFLPTEAFHETDIFRMRLPTRSN